MKSSVTHTLTAGVMLFLGGLLTPIRADILYTSNLGSIETVPSSGVPATFDTISLNNPQEIAFSLSGTLYVANFGSNSIEEFSQAGADLGTFASGSSVLSGPVGMAFDGAGNLYVANQNNGSIEKFSTAGTPSVFVPASAGLISPSALAFDSAGNLYVASYGGNSIQKFSATGTSLGTFATGSTILSGPDGMAFDSSGNLYVANAGSGTIEKFSSSGSPSLFASTGLSAPVGLAFDSSGTLYAANSGNGTVEKFSSTGSPTLFASGFTAGGPEYLAFTTNSGQPVLGLGSGLASAQYWNGAVISANGTVNGGAGTWDNVSTNWTDSNGATSAAWTGTTGVFAGTAGTVTLGANISFSSLEFQTNGYVINGDAGNAFSLKPGLSAGIITDVGVTATINAPMTGSGSLTKSGVGTLILGGANTYTGATTISSGTLLAGLSFTVPSTSAVIVNTGATFDLNSLSQSVGSIADGPNGGGTISLGSAGLTTGHDNTSTSFSGAIQDGGVSGQTQGSLTKVGTGSLTLSGANTYTGPTTISAGAIQFAQTVSLAGTTGSTTVNANAHSLIVQSGAFAIFNVGGAGEFSPTQISELAALGSNLGGFESGSYLGLDTTDAPGSVVLTSGIANPNSGANVLNLVKFGTGSLTFDAANSYTGLATVANGTLITAVAGALPAGANLSLGTGNSATVAGQVDLFGTNQAVNVLSLTPGNSAGTANVITSTNGAASLSVNSGAFGGLITGPISFVKAGTFNSVLFLSGANTYTGSTTVEAGQLRIGVNNALPTSTTLTLNGANGQGGEPDFILSGHNQTVAALNLVAGYLTNDTVNISGGVLTLNGNVNMVDNTTAPGTGGSSSIVDSTGGGALDLGNATRTFNVAGQSAQAQSQDLQITAVIRGNGGVVINATPSTSDGYEGGLVFGAGNTYTGSTTVAQGRLTTTVSNALPATTDLILGTANSALTGDVDLSGTSQTVNSVSVASGNTGGTGNFITTNNGPATLTVSSTTTNSTIGNLLVGQISLVKGGAGTTLTLTGTNSYTGTTTVTGGTLNVSSSITGGGAVNINGGTLTVDGSIASTSAVGVNSGGTLAGTGSANGTVTVASGGNLNPGDATPGTITVGNLVLNAGANSNFRLAQAGTAGGGINDLVAVTGNLTLSGNLNVTELTGFGIGSYTLFTYGGTLTSNGFTAINLLGNFNTTIVTGVAGAVDLTVSVGTSQYWDGTGAINNGVISGGSGTWNATSNNWTNFSGSLNSTWQSGTAVFAGTSGTVNLTSAVSALGLTFGSNGYVISGSSTLTLLGPAPTISVTAAGNTATVGVKLAGTAGLAANGSGTLILTNAANSYTGGTTISNGTVQIGTATAAGSLGAGAVSIGNGGTLALVSVSGNALSANISNGIGAVGTVNVNSKNTNTLSGTLTDATGQLALTQSGPGTTILTNAGNTYSGATTVSAGVLQIGTTTAAGSIGASSTVSVGGGSTLSLVNVHGNTLANNITNGASGIGLVSINSATSITLSGNLSDGTGTLALTKSGAAATILSGDNTYGGVTTVSAGTLQIGNGSGTFMGAGNVNVASGATLALDLADTSTVTANLILSGSSTLKGLESSGATNTVGGIISGTGGVTQSGAGTTILNGVNTYTGTTSITAGALEIDGSVAAGSTVNIATGGTLQGTGAIKGKVTLTGNGSITFGPGGIIDGTLAVTGGTWGEGGIVEGLITSSSGVFTIDDTLTAAAGMSVTGGTITGTATYYGNLNYASSLNSTFAGIISGTGSTVTMNHAGSTLILTGANAYMGATNISAGTLQVGDGNTTGTTLGTGAITVSGSGVLAINLPDTSTFSKNVSLAATGATLKTIQAGANTLSGVISGAGGLNQNGTGTTIVTGAEIYTGTTSVTTGTLQVDGSLAAASTVNVAAAGTLSGTGTVAGTVNLLAGGNLDAGDSSGPGTLTVGKLVLNTGSNANFRLAAPGTVGGGINDLVNVTGNLTIAGNLNVTALPGFGTLGSYTLFTYGGTLTNTGFSAINGIGGYAAAVSTGVAHQVNLIVSGTAVTQYWDGTGAINNNLISGGSGTWNNTTNNWTNSTGGTNAGWQGGTAVFNAPGGTVTLGAPINVQGLLFGSTGYTLGGTSTLNLVGTATMAPTISVTNAGTTATISAPIIGKAGLTSSGAGTLILSSMTNSYTGGTNITNGLVQIGTTAAGGSIGGGTISIASSGTLALVNLHGNLLANNVTNGVATTTGTLLVNATTANTLSGALTDGSAGQLALTQSGTGTTILTNAGNAFSGATTISKGMLQIGTTTAAGSLGFNSVATVDTGATLSLVNVAGNILYNNISNGVSGTDSVSINSANNLTLSGALTNGAGVLALTKAGTGTTTLTGSDTYTGATTVSAGALQIGNGTAGNLTSTSTVTVSGTGSLAMDLADTSTFTRSVNLSAATTALKALQTGTNTLSGVISGTGSVNQSGAGTTILSGANTYKGGTTISAGLLLVGNATGSGTGSGTVTVNNTGTLGGSGTISGPTTLNSGGSITPGAGSSGTAGTTLHANSTIWNGGGTLTLQLGPSANDALALTGALTKGSAGGYAVDILDDGGITHTSYTLVTFSSTTFAQTNFTLDMPAGYTGQLVETSTSLTLDVLSGSGQQPDHFEDAAVTTTDDFGGAPTQTIGSDSDSLTSSTLTVTPTPEPGSAALLAFGGAALLGWRRRRRG